MGSNSDGRGSEPQRYLFELVKEIYSNYDVIYELFIPDLNQRFDIFVLELGIAIEYDGDQHNKFNEFFHKDMNGFILSKKLDNNKEKFCEENGIKLVRLQGFVFDINKNKLCELIDNVKYPDEDFCIDILRYESVRLKKDRERRHEKYMKIKSRDKNKSGI
ncbi:MAG: hypothetical protein DRQ78_10955 [Epsilonproteobacteria bacterium]|nr:MAG: hypothetical protein DRQ78_10955 [Campylobacterota bacterium]